MPKLGVFIKYLTILFTTLRWHSLGAAWYRAHKNTPGEFLDEQLARARENEIIEPDNIDESDDEDSLPRYELTVVPEGYVMDEETARDFLACNDRMILRNY